jgi:hypothetical protein
MSRIGQSDPPKSIAHELALAHLPSKNATGLRRFNDVVSAPRRGGIFRTRLGLGSPLNMLPPIVTR